MKNKKFLIIYGIIILIILIAIIFILPDKFFKKPQKIEFVDDSVSIEEQIDKVKNNHYEYKYLIQYSVQNNDSTYKCTGKVDGEVENGICTSPTTFNYTNENKKEVFNSINTDCLDSSYIFDLVKEIPSVQKNLGDTVIYVYKTTIDKQDTDISLYSNNKEIFQIEITNIYGTYVITLSNIS